MKMKLAFASLLVLSGCGASREALLALEDMQILENNPDANISYASLSGSGNNLTLNDVEVRMPAPPAEMIEVEITDEDDADDAAPAAEPAPDAAPAKATTVARAKSMTLKGLTLKNGKPFATDIVVNDITTLIPNDAATLTLKSLGFEGMNEVTGSYIARAFTKDGPGETPPIEQWGFKKAGLGGLAFNSPIPQEEGESGNVTIALGELSVSNLVNTNLGLFRFDGLKGDVSIPGELPVAGTFDFGKMDISGIRTKLFSDAFAVGMQPLFNPGAPVDYSQMYKDYTSPLESGFDQFDWTGLTSNFSGLKFDVSPMQATQKRNADGVVVASDTPMTKLKFTADSSGGTLGAMGLMVLAMGGYTSNVVELYTEGHATFDPAKDMTHWDGLSIGVTDAFDVKVSGGIIGLKQALPSLMTGLMTMAESAEMNFDEDDSSADDEDADEHEGHEGHEGHEDHADHQGHDGHDADADEDEDSDAADAPDVHEHTRAKKPDNSAAMMSLMMGVMPLQLTDLDIEITDQKLVNLIIEPQAISSGQTVQAYRQQLVDMVTASAAFMTDAGVDAAIANELTTAVSGFLAGPGTFHIVLKPKAPLGVMSAMMTPMTKENLGFSATFTAATPPAPKVN